MNSELFPPGLASRSSKRKWLTLIGGGTIITTIISLVLIFSLTQLREAKHDETRQYLDANTTLLKRSIQNHLDTIEVISEELAANIENSSLAPDDIQKILEETGGIYDGFVAIGAAFEPYALDEKLRLFAPYIVHFEGGYKTVRLDAY